MYACMHACFIYTGDENKVRKWLADEETSCQSSSYKRGASENFACVQANGVYQRTAMFIGPVQWKSEYVQTLQVYYALRYCISMAIVTN